MKTILTPRNFFECFQDNSKQLLLALQDLYESEINFKIETFWDDGFKVCIGDELNGYKDEALFDTFNECIIWLSEKAIEFYPNSKFAKDYKIA